MKLFENKVGRPSNEIRSKRRKFVASAVSLSLVAIFAITLAVKNVATNNLQGKAMGNNTGDIDGSGTVNYKDLELALKHIANIKKLNSKEIKYGDVNNDKKINYTDAKEILRKGNFGKIVGDVDNDKKVTESDAKQILRYAANLDTPNEAQKKAADMDGDGKITATDARLALIKVYGTSTRRGDMDGDGKITAADARIVNRFVGGKEKPNGKQKKLADVDGDGNITAKDVNILTNVQAGLVGNVDGDDAITFGDVTKIVNSVAKITNLSKEEKKAADVDGDGSVTMKDAKALSLLIRNNTGDADGDGRVSKEDAKLVARYASKQKVTNEQKARIEKYCDMDGNKNITMSDARIIYRISQN